MNIYPASSLIVGALLSLAFLRPASAAVLIDFETAGDFTNNFRPFYNPTETNTVQASGVVSTSAVTTSSGTTLAETFIYDSTPADAVVKNTFSGPVTISFNLRGAQTGASFGIYIVNPNEAAGLSNHRLALFNLDNSGTNDQFRIFSTSAISSSSVDTVAYTSGPVSAGINVGGGFVAASLVYKEGATGHAIMNYTVNGVSTGDVDLGVGTYSSSFEVGLRLYDASTGAGSSDIDNFAIVPEPSSIALAGLGLGVLGIMALRRRCV